MTAIDPSQETARAYRTAFEWADDEAIAINLSIQAAYWALKSAETSTLSSLGFGRTSGRFGVLREVFLSPERRLTQNEIATRLDITSATVTFLVDGLEKQGIVSRITNQADRRSVYVGLTERGVETCNVLMPAMARLAASIVEDFTKEEKATLLQLLTRIRKNAARQFE